MIISMNESVLSLSALPRGHVGQLGGSQSGRGAVIPHVEGSL